MLLHVQDELGGAGQLDGICLAVFDRDSTGGEFGRFYQLRSNDADDISLPQTLAVEPGEATSAFSIARGYLGGVEVARATAVFDFSTTDVSLPLGACGGARASENVAVHNLPANARVAVSVGRDGSRVVAVGAGEAVVLNAASGVFVVDAQPLPELPMVAPSQLLAFDADADCDDDILLLFEAASPQLWRRDGSTFVAVPDAFTGVPAVRTGAVIDADGDGDIDLVVGAAASLFVLRNDGTGRFQVEGGGIPASASAVTDDVTAVATGDIDGDGHPDVIVGRGSITALAMTVLVNDHAGTGFFEVAPATLPGLPLRVRALAVADVDGDGARDLVVASNGDHVRLYINRGGLLEDKSFVLLPNVDSVTATSMAVADWDAACLPDIAVATGSSTALWSGGEGGEFRQDATMLPAADQVIAADVDDDGRVELLVVSGNELTWVQR